MMSEEELATRPFCKKYFSDEMISKYEPLATAIELVNETDGQDEEVWRDYQVHLRRFRDFEWCPKTENEQKKFDLVFYGVSGYTGYLMMEYLKRVALKVSPEEFTFAFAGRTPSKVREMRNREFVGTQWADTPILQMSYDDTLSIINLCKSAKCIINVAGPYMLTQGELMVDACIQLGVHYVDISGEVPWTMRIIDLHKHAEKAGVYIIPSAASAGGFPDLGVHLLAKEARNRYGEELRKAICYTTGGGQTATASGGTLKTRSAMASAGDEVRAKMADPFSMGGFIPDRDRWGMKYCNIEFGTGKCTPKMRSEDADANMARVSEDKHLGVWRGPHVYSYFDTRIVRRSNMLFADLANQPYGRNLNFLEFAMLPEEVLALQGKAPARASVEEEEARLRAAGTYYGEGEGPPLEELENAWCGFFMWAQTESGHELKNWLLIRDGYFETARVAVETAMALVFDKDKLPFRGGFLTPTVACGDFLNERMERGNVKWQTTPWPAYSTCKPPPLP